MFNSAFGIFSCQNGYHCFQGFILSAISIVTLLLYLKVYKIVSKDRSQILDKMDKIIFYLALVCIGFQTFTEVLYTGPFLAFTMRVLYLVLTIVMCSVVAVLYFPQEHARVEQLMMGCFGWTVLLWFFSVMGKNTTSANAENECHYFSIILFSLTGLAISGALAFCAYNTIKNIKQSELTEGDEYTDGATGLDKIRGQQEKNNLVNQLSLFIIITAGPAFVQMLWDLKKYNMKYTLTQCSKVSLPHTFIDLIVFTMMEVITKFLLPWGIFYAYYWKNRESFGEEGDNWERNLSDFDEVRSDLIEP